MGRDMDRRAFLSAAGGLAAAGIVSQAVAAAAAEPQAGKKVKIVAVACSPRPGKTTAAALKAALDAAAKAGANVETELIELAGLNIPVFDPAAADAPSDFAKVAAKLTDPAVAAIIVGTPVYFSNMSSLCKAFLDHCMALRKAKFALSGKVAGVLAVGGVRNGGQELAIASVQAALMCQEMIVVGDGKPTAHTGATLVNTGDDISGDQFGLGTAANLGQHVAEVALRLAGASKA